MKIYGKKDALGQLKSFASSGRMPHALMFYGESGIGKKVLADYAAMLYMCEKHGATPCFSCNECKRIEQHQHPDVIYVTDLVQASKTKVEKMREIVKDGYIMPNDNAVRVYIFADVDILNIQCQNTLLKFIEEPLEFNRFVFTTSSVASVLPTILSRVTKLGVEKTSVAECKDALVEMNTAAEKAAELSEMFSGNIGKCIAAENDENEIKTVNTVKNVMSAVAAKNEYKAAAAMTAFTTRADQNKAVVLMQEIIRDAMVYQSGGKSFIGCDHALAMKLADAFSQKRLFEAEKVVEKYILLADIALNVNITASAIVAELFGVLS